MKDSNYLMEELENGKKLKVLCLSYDSNFLSYLCDLANIYKNLEIDCSVCGINWYNKNVCRTKDYDFIISYGNSNFDVIEFENMKKLAQEISYREDKQVGISFSYFMPKSESFFTKQIAEMKIASFRGPEIKEETISNPFTFPFSISEYMKLLLTKYQELNQNKIQKKIILINSCTILQK